MCHKRKLNTDVIIKETNGKGGIKFREVRPIEASPVQKKVVLNIQQAHERLGHSNEDATRKTAQALGWTITKGSLKPCEACAVAKAKQKNLPKKDNKEPKQNDGKNRMYLDIQTFKKKDEDAPNITKPHLCLRVLESTQLKFGSFHQAKNEMVEPVCQQLHKWKQKGKAVDVIRIDTQDCSWVPVWDNESESKVENLK